MNSRLKDIEATSMEAGYRGSPVDKVVVNPPVNNGFPINGLFLNGCFWLFSLLS